MLSLSMSVSLRLVSFFPFSFPVVSLFVVALRPVSPLLLSASSVSLRLNSLFSFSLPVVSLFVVALRPVSPLLVSAPSVSLRLNSLFSFSFRSVNSVSSVPSALNLFPYFFASLRTPSLDSLTHLINPVAQTSVCALGCLSCLSSSLRYFLLRLTPISI